MKLFGPVHAYVAPPPAFGVLREIDPPSHKVAGEADAVGAAGLAFTVTDAVVLLQQYSGKP